MSFWGSFHLPGSSRIRILRRSAWLHHLRIAWSQRGWRESDARLHVLPTSAFERVAARSEIRGFDRQKPFDRGRDVGGLVSSAGLLPDRSLEGRRNGMEIINSSHRPRLSFSSLVRVDYYFLRKRTFAIPSRTFRRAFHAAFWSGHLFSRHRPGERTYRTTPCAFVARLPVSSSCGM